MSKNGDSMQERADLFVRRLFDVYLVERDFDQLLQMMHPNVSWFGTGAHEVCRNYDDAKLLLESERDSSVGGFKILDIWTQTIYVDEENCTVFGEMKIKQDGMNTLLIDMDSRFSMQCREEQGKMYLYHAHYSVANPAQAEGEFVHKTIAENYNKLLEKALEERTKLLLEKSFELESLANNISGGLQICSFDDNYTIHFVSDGFLKLFGYTREEVLNTSHLALVHPDDVRLLSGEIYCKLEANREFSSVYRMVRKDGSVRWVLENGGLFKGQSGQDEVQSCLTDITEQKQQEEELRVSQKRYEVAMKQMDVSMFEYNIETRQLTLFEQDASLYGVQTVLDDGPRVLAESGHFDSECVPEYLEMYRKVCSGEEANASCMMTAHDVDGKLHEFELSLTAMLDQSGKPMRAIGVRKNATHLRKLQREQEFGKTMTGGRSFICEADVTSDRILRIDSVWSRLLGVYSGGNYSEAMKRVLGLSVDEEKQQYLKSRLNLESLEESLELGKYLEHFSFSNEDEMTGKLMWHEATINIIRDESSGNICVRIYHEDISERKRNESQAAEERRLYESMLSKAMVAYEVNISRDMAIRGHEKWNKQFGISTSTCYGDMINAFAMRGMKSEDGQRFLNAFSRMQVLKAFYDGETELSCQYRKIEPDNSYIWVECTLHMFEDPESGDIRGYSYVENIDKQKRAELELRYKAEHDALTDLYNKETTAELVTQYLESLAGKRGLHAFLMVDLDHFKGINDCFGHLFGDGVIAEMGGYLRSLFGEEDVVGRIGGDEFCVFIKQVGSIAAVKERAKILCKTLTKSYSEGGYARCISASVGIALYPAQGRNFEELYRHADNAMYDAKRGGRNRYSLAD